MEKFMLLLYVLFFLGSCSSPKYPYLSQPESYKNNVKGSYFMTKMDRETVVLGEIIEVNPNEMKILSFEASSGIRTYSKSEIESGEILIALTSDNPEKFRKWAGWNSLGILAHGLWAVFTIPINVSMGLVTADNATNGTYRVKYPENISWIEMQKFARFPQGIPNTIDPSLIK